MGMSYMKYFLFIVLVAAISSMIVLLLSINTAPSEPTILSTPRPTTTTNIKPTPKPALEWPVTQPIEPTPVPTPSKPTTQLPSSVILKDVQFASQAPLRNWALPYQEFCEEASSLMAAFYALQKPLPNAQGISDELMRIKAFEDEYIGHYEDTTAKETTRILKELYGLTDVTLIHNPTIEDIQAQLAQEKVILVPSAGRMLGNPYFRAPGPLYHMIVLKGYTQNGYFISQDPGTNTKGENLQYEFETIMEAMHDWNDGDVNTGAKVVIAVGRQK